MSAHRGIDRIVELLDAVARARNPPTVSELAREVSAPRSSVHDLVLGLLEHGWLVRTGRGFGIGPAPLVLELLAERHVPWTTINVDAYADRFDVAAASAVLLGRHVVYTARSRKTIDQGLAVVADQYLPRNPLTTAAGRLLLSAAPRAVLTGVLDEARKSHPALVNDYESRLSTIRRNRQAWSDGLSQDHVSAVALFPSANSREALVLFGRRGVDTALLKTVARAIADDTLL